MSKYDFLIDEEIVPFYTTKDEKYFVMGVSTFEEIENYLMLMAQQSG